MHNLINSKSVLSTLKLLACTQYHTIQQVPLQRNNSRCCTPWDPGDAVATEGQLQCLAWGVGGTAMGAWAWGAGGTGRLRAEVLRAAMCVRSSVPGGVSAQQDALLSPPSVCAGI